MSDPGNIARAPRRAPLPRTSSALRLIGARLERVRHPLLPVLRARAGGTLDRLPATGYRLSGEPLAALGSTDGLEL